MTKEQKDLLMKDLCSRLPYGVKGQYNNTVMSLHMINPFDNYCPLYCVTESGSKYIGIDEFKPYLLPLSSMTAEQKREYARIVVMSGNIATARLAGMTVQDWFSKNHFDYRGLIPMGLANDATGLNIY